jgi:hypothetical protein
MSLEFWSCPHVEVGSNTSTVTLRVPRDSDQRKTVLARTSSIYKRQTQPLIREGAPQKQDRNCQTVINIWSSNPDGAQHHDWLTDWLTDWLSDWLTETDQPTDRPTVSHNVTLTSRVHSWQLENDKSPAQAAVIRGPEHWKLKNVHC